MNVVVLMGRLTADPETRYTQDEKAVSRYTLAVDRRFSRDGETDFIRCVVFGKGAEFTEKYFRKGMRVTIQGHIQTGSYKDKDGRTVYTTDVIVESQEFAQSKGENSEAVKRPAQGTPKLEDDDFVRVPDGLEEELPFN